MHKQPLSNSANPQPAEGFVQEKHQLPEGISDISAGGGAIQDRSGLLQVCMHRYTHIYMYVYIKTLPWMCRPAPASCVAHGAHQARSAHKQPLSNSANPQPAEGFVQEKHRLPEGISDISAGGGAIQDRSGLLQVCMYRYTHIYTYVYRLVYKTLPWLRRPALDAPAASLLCGARRPSGAISA